MGICVLVYLLYTATINSCIQKTISSGKGAVKEPVCVNINPFQIIYGSCLVFHQFLDWALPCGRPWMAVSKDRHIRHDPIYSCGCRKYPGRLVHPIDNKEGSTSAQSKKDSCRYICIADCRLTDLRSAYYIQSDYSIGNFSGGRFWICCLYL